VWKIIVGILITFSKCLITFFPICIFSIKGQIGVGQICEGHYCFLVNFENSDILSIINIYFCIIHGYNAASLNFKCYVLCANTLYITLLRAIIESETLPFGTQYSDFFRLYAVCKGSVCSTQKSCYIVCRNKKITFKICIFSLSNTTTFTYYVKSSNFFKRSLPPRLFLSFLN